MWILLGIGFAGSAAWLVLMRDRLNMAWYAAIPLAIFHTIFGVLTVKVFAFLETGFDKATLGNMSLFGGVFFMPVAYWLGAKIFKRPMKEVFDVFTPCMIFTVMCARINCILSGCCTGLIIPGTQLRCPTRELELVYYIVMLILLIPRVKRMKTPAPVTHSTWQAMVRSGLLSSSFGHRARGCCFICPISGPRLHLRQDSVFT